MKKVRYVDFGYKVSGVDTYEAQPSEAGSYEVKSKVERRHEVPSCKAGSYEVESCEATQYGVASHEGRGKIIRIYPTPERHPPKNTNYRKGEPQEVFAFKTEEEVKAIGDWLLEHGTERDFVAYTLGVNLGLRGGELLSLKVSDVLYEDGTIKFEENLKDTSDGIVIKQSKTSKSKNNKYRVVYLNVVCKDVLDRYFKKYNYKDKSEYLFPSKKGGSISVDRLRRILKEAAQACGVKQNVGTHSLRKTFGYNVEQLELTERRGDISVLQRLFGHSSPLVTYRYTGSSREEDKEVYRKLEILTTSSTEWFTKDEVTSEEIRRIKIGVHPFLRHRRSSSSNVQGRG